ncbi:glycerophosphodiester phosphodiesterase [Halomicrococcus gelatinilyticus]|uniref:glycerophosphodiester phosphodiesterase n=1 Tax=Halomicrococcus gelatinilyticus TaxID=1702103 RepID=UPI002E16144A
MPTELQAHRGFAGEHPENTLRAVREAADRADRIEVDVHRCGSGELVVFHDETLSRLTDAHGPVAETPWPELRDLEVLGSGETIPRLDDVVDAVPDGVGLNVELKHAGIADPVLAATTDVDDVLFSSFHRRALAELRDRDPDATLAYVSDRGPNCVDTAVDLGCSFVHPAKELCDETLVDRAHVAGLGVNAWTVTTREEAATLQAAGVDGVIADSPAVL